jgi:hypothetical protein
MIWCNMLPWQKNLKNVAWSLISANYCTSAYQAIYGRRTLFAALFRDLQSQAEVRKCSAALLSFACYNTFFHVLMLLCFVAGGVLVRHHASKNVWPYMLSICLAYFVTLCLFPGVESEIISCSLGSWMPVILMGLFNLFDFIGKVSTLKKL